MILGIADRWIDLTEFAFCLACTESHRSDVNLYDVFESLFPGQIEHAEMLIDTSHLEKTLEKRRALIEKYDDVDARYRYECWRYKTWQQTGKSIGCCRTSISEPVKPKVSCSFFLL